MSDLLLAVTAESRRSPRPRHPHHRCQESRNSRLPSSSSSALPSYILMMTRVRDATTLLAASVREDESERASEQHVVPVPDVDYEAH